jgi:hypothetical protein
LPPFAPIFSGYLPPAGFLPSFGGTLALAGAGFGFPSLLLFLDSLVGAYFFVGAEVFFSSSSEDSFSSSSEDCSTLNSYSSDSFASSPSLDSTIY